jgi:xanthine dehydrogenase accessory factor
VVEVVGAERGGVPARRLTDMTLAFYETVARLLREGRAVAIATVIGSRGSTPRGAGSRMVVTADGAAAFSVGGGAFEALVVADARAALAEGRGFEKEYRFVESGEGAVGMVCGGSARVLFEVVRPPIPLVVFGAGHVGREVAHLAARLGFEVTVVDDRPAQLDPAAFPPGARLERVASDFSGPLPEIPAGAAVAILTRCHRTDLLALRHAAGAAPSYIGVIGSRRKVAVLKERAAGLGVPRAALDGLRAPIGLPIGAETPAEIAVSIVAEIIHLRHAGGGAEKRARGVARRVATVGVGPEPAGAAGAAAAPAATVTPIRGRSRARLPGRGA